LEPIPNKNHIPGGRRIEQRWSTKQKKKRNRMEKERNLDQKGNIGLRVGGEKSHLDGVQSIECLSKKNETGPKIGKPKEEKAAPKLRVQLSGGGLLGKIKNALESSSTTYWIRGGACVLQQKTPIKDEGA